MCIVRPYRIDTKKRVNLLKFIYAFSVLVLWSSASMAQDTPNNQPSPPLLDQDKMYAEFFVGRAEQELEDPTGVTFSGDGLLFGLRSGYSFNRYLAAELGFSMHGKSESDVPVSASETVTSTMSSSSFDAGFKATLPLFDSFFINARAGMAAWQYDIELTSSLTPDTPYEGEDSGYDPYFGGAWFINRMIHFI